MPAERTETGTGSRSDTRLLSPLPPAETYESGVDLTCQGEPAACVYLVVEGVVKLVHVSQDGSEHIVELAGPGDFVGVDSAIRAGRCSETAVTLTKCSLARWKAAEFLARLNNDTGFAVQVCRMISRHAQALRRHLLEFGVQSAGRRLEGLIRWYSHHGLAGAGSSRGAFDLPFTREELRQFLFITPFQVSRLLGLVEKAGLIDRKGRHIRVLPAALQRTAAQRA